MHTKSFLDLSGKNFEIVYPELPAVIQQISPSNLTKSKIEETLALKVRYSSAIQTTKGVFSSGITNSVSYVYQKLKKSFNK